MSGEVVLARDILPRLTMSTSIWGEYDILNSEETSRTITGRVQLLVGNTQVRNGIYIGMRMIIDPANYRLPLRVFDANPEDLGLETDDRVIFVCGPLTAGEAMAAGYLLETAAINRDIIDGIIETSGPAFDSRFGQIVAVIGGERRFVPLGLLTVYDYVARMVHYRRIREDFQALGMSEDDEEDLGLVVGEGIIPLARAFRTDGYVIGENCQRAVDGFYVGHQRLFIPFAGLGRHPRDTKDWTMVGLGLYTGIRLFRKIEKQFVK